MGELLNKVEYEITNLHNTTDGVMYKVSIKVPIELGFIERMKFITETSNNEKEAYQLHHVKNDGKYVYFEGEYDIKNRDLYYYHFSFEVNHKFIYYKRINRDNVSSISRNEMWQMGSKSKNNELVDTSKVPEWTKGKIMYQIFVDRFNRGNREALKEMPNRVIHKSWNEDIMIGPNENGLWCTDFYGGDLAGIIEKLGYIKSLGVSILYLTPIVSSQSNHRYDASDYEKVDPYAGCNEDLKELCDKAHSMGIKIVLDAVFNHTGNDSKYYNEFNHFNELGAYQSNESKYYPFYRKHYVNGHVYFEHWWGMGNLPVCDGYSKEWQDYIYGYGGIIDQWFQLGIDGLRLDVADELTDDFIEGIRKAVKRNKEDGFIIGEVWKNPTRMGRRYFDPGKGMDSVMNYQLINALMRYYKYADNTFLNHILNEILREYPKDTINSLMNFTSTHDISRAINIFSSNEFKYDGEWVWDEINGNREYQKNYKMVKDDYERGKKIYQSYLYALAFLPGIMSIFYGDEIGMEGLGNLANRRPFTWNKIDYDILNTVKKLGHIRNNEKFLEKADLELVDINPNYMSFIRKLDDQEALIMLSRSGERKEIIVPKAFRDLPIKYNLNNSNKDELSEYGGIVLKKMR